MTLLVEEQVGLRRVRSSRRSDQLVRTDGGRWAYAYILSVCGRCFFHKALERTVTVMRGVFVSCPC